LVSDTNQQYSSSFSPFSHQERGEEEEEEEGRENGIGGILL